MQWQKEKSPFGFNGEKNHDVYTAISDDGFLIQCLNAGDGSSYLLNRERFVHWVIAFVKPQSNGYFHKKEDFFEPSYQQKLMVLRNVGVWKNIALEVMPPEDEVIDRENLYHLWEFQYPYSLIFNYQPILQEPVEFKSEYQGLEYHLSVNGPIRYLYFKSKTNNDIGWRKKQNLKNYVIGLDGTAVELITEEMSDKNYGCMICLPRNEYLDFGLN